MNQPTTVPKFEQAVAALAGLFTAGPVGALAAWGAIRGLRGKWTPWLVLGFPAALTINVVQLAVAVMLLSPFIEIENQYPPTILAGEPEIVYDI